MYEKVFIHDLYNKAIQCMEALRWHTTALPQNKKNNIIRTVVAITTSSVPSVGDLGNLSTKKDQQTGTYTTIIRTTPEQNTQHSGSKSP